MRRERMAWSWPAGMEPSEWAEKYRFLGEDEADLVGPWRNVNAPYLVGVMDLANRPGIERITHKKAAQGGVSEAMRNLIGYWAHQDPAPVGLALSNEKKGREIVENKILPFFRRTFAQSGDRGLNGLITQNPHDLKKSQIRLANGFLMHLMWSGSAASLASNPMKRAVADEVNKFSRWVGEEADPISLIEKRLRTYENRLLLLVSTPTNSTGVISQSFAASDPKLYFLIACPFCKLRQRMVFPQLRIPDAIRLHPDRSAAARACLNDGAVWYECRGCGERLDEQAKRRAVRGGVWGTVGEDQVTADGVIADAMTIPYWPPGTWIGMHISALYYLWDGCTMGHVAAEFLRAEGDRSRIYDFRTQTLGEDWEEVTQRVDPIVIDRKVGEATLAEGVLPWWTDRLIAAVDSQGDHFWVVIRAWGSGMRSARVWHGRVDSFAELDRWCLDRAWACEDNAVPARRCDLVVVDTGGTRSSAGAVVESEGVDNLSTPAPGIPGTPGATGPSRVMEVYGWLLSRQPFVRAIKGDARPLAGQYIRRGRGLFVTDRDKRQLPLWLLDVHHFQDELASLMSRRLSGDSGDSGDSGASGGGGGDDIWRLNRRQDHEYARHMANLRKVTVRTGSGGGGLAERWHPVSPGARVDYRHCEGYQVAAAYMQGVHLLPDLDSWRKLRDEDRLEMLRAAERRRPALMTPDGRPFLVTERT